MNLRITAVLVILLVVGGSYIYFFELQANPEETGSSSNGAVSIYEREYNEYDVVGLEVVGPYNSAHFARTDDTFTQDWKMLRPNSLPAGQIDQVRVNGAAYRLGRLAASQVITGVTNLAQYGLAPPELTVTLTISDGQKITLFTGAQTPVNADRYLQMAADGETVYLVYGLAIDELARLLDDPPLLSVPLPAITSTVVR